MKRFHSNKKLELREKKTFKKAKYFFTTKRYRIIKGTLLSQLTEPK